jgi:hypothetical protein
MGAFDLLAKAAKGAKKAAPFFSKADVVLDELQRGKGAGNEFLGELVKKGAKPTELRERGIEKALKDKPKMTKAEVQKIFDDNPPPRVQEKVLSDQTPDYEDFLEAKAQEEYGVDWFDLGRQEKARIERMFNELPTTQYDQYKTPGGENYREILLKLPKRGLNKMEQDELMLYEADLRRTDGQATPERMARYQELKAKEPDNATNYTSSHYKEDPNLLAHIRVQDFQAPSRGFAVINTRSGNRSEVFPSMEQAQAYLAQMPENMQGMLRIDEAAGKPKKVLLVDEIQSDWHQAGRKGGYSNKYKPEDLSPYSKEQAQSEFGLDNADLFWYLKTPDQVFQIPKSRFDSMDAAAQYVLSEKTTAGAVPDAPFKKNWHELSMKRILDYAAENGYDSVAITPGVQQVKRYEDATRQAVDEVAMYGATLVGFKDGRRVIEQPISSPDELEQYIGKDMAQKLSSAAPDMNFIRSIKGEDITVGGEGMKGFYDKILPDYLNNYGKKYGASVEQSSLPIGLTEESKRLINDAYGRGTLADIDLANAQAQQQMHPVHFFNITPQMREEIMTKGQPMYGKVATPVLEGLAAGSGAATIGSEVFDTNNEQQVQNPVHFTENPDAMLLELMQRN